MSVYLGRDNEFRKKLGSYEDFVEGILECNPLRMLIGIKQFATHGGLDPLEHTYNVLMLLSTDDFYLSIKDLRRSVAEILRISVKYHDIGKLKGSFNIFHAVHSAPMAEEILTNPHLYGEEEFTIKEIILIKKLIGTHDILGRLSQKIIPLEVALKELTPPDGINLSAGDMLAMHYRIIRADIGSIPMLRDRVWQIDKVYEVLDYEMASNECR